MIDYPVREIAPNPAELIADWERVRALHSRQQRWERSDATGSFESKEAAEAWDDTDGVDFVPSFAICTECGRIEAEANEDAGPDDWGYRESIWPCNTARTLGATA